MGSMSELYALASLLSLLGAAFLLTRLLAPRCLVEGALLFAVLYSTLILLLGYLLSELNLLRSLAGWAVLSLLALALCCVPMLLNARRRARCLRPLAIPREIEGRIAGANYSRFDTLLLLALALVMSVCAVVNFSVLISLEPDNLDGLSYHLPRIMYYLEHGNLHYFGASYWAIVIHPKVATVLMLYTYLLADLSACCTQLVQYLAYFISVAAVYGITRQLGCSRRRGAFAALIFSLGTIMLMEAVSPQNDFVLTAFTGCALYFLLAYRAVHARKYLCFAALAFALALGVKATMLLVLPSLLIVAVFALLPLKALPANVRRKHVGAGAAALCLALLIVTLPSGYGENWQRFGNPFGPASVREKHTVEGKGVARLAKNVTLNLLRYGFDFVALDGVLPTPRMKALQRAITAPGRWLLQRAKINLESDEASRRAFSFEHYYLASENCSYWGILGWLLLWPAVLIACFRRSGIPGLRWFALAALLYFLVQASASPYDPWRGRYFMTAALFAAPTLAALAFPAHLPGKLYLAFAVFLGCVTALTAVCFRCDTSVFPLKGVAGCSSFVLGRTEQLSREMPDLAPAWLKYESCVPEGAVVATDTTFGCEYLFFGDRLSRRIIPLRSFTGERRPVPAEAQYLLYSLDSPYAQHGDTAICTVYFPYGPLYLRKLK